TGELLAVPDDPDRALDHDEQASADLALPGDDVVGREVDLEGALADRREIGDSDPAEQRAAAEQLGPAVLGERHGSSCRAADAARSIVPASTGGGMTARCATAAEAGPDNGSPSAVRGVRMQGPDRDEDPTPHGHPRRDRRPDRRLR